jgi:hypothetical protein
MEQVLRLYFSTFAAQKMVQTQQPIKAREKVIKGFKKSFCNFYFYFASKKVISYICSICPQVANVLD